MILMILLVFLVLTVSANCFTFSYRMNGINRTLLNTPISYFEIAIPLVQETDNINLYFDKNLLESNLNSYYSKQLEKYSNDYEIKYLYFNQSDHSASMSDYSNAVTIKIKSHMYLSFYYEQSMDFSIRRANGN